MVSFLRCASEYTAGAESDERASRALLRVPPSSSSPPSSPAPSSEFSFSCVFSRSTFQRSRWLIFCPSSDERAAVSDGQLAEMAAGRDEEGESPPSSCALGLYSPETLRRLASTEEGARERFIGHALAVSVQ